MYLYRGTKDSCYHEGSVRHSQTFFEALGAHVLFNATTPSAHSWPTRSYGTPCGQGVIESCNYDGPGAALQHIYGGALRPPVDADPALLRQFDQRPFMSADNLGNATFNETTPHVTGFADSGWIYVPSGCGGQRREPSGAEERRQKEAEEGEEEEEEEQPTQQTGGKTKKGKKCRLHFSLHGCGVNEYYDEAVHHLGFQDWGEANDIVVVFPRIQPHGGTTETQSGCWDGYAQTGVDYALQSGAQMQGMRKMIAAVAGV